MWCVWVFIAYVFAHPVHAIPRSAKQPDRRPSELGEKLSLASSAVASLHITGKKLGDVVGQSSCTKFVGLQPPISLRTRAHAKRTEPDSDVLDEASAQPPNVSNLPVQKGHCTPYDHINASSLIEIGVEFPVPGTRMTVILDPGVKYEDIPNAMMGLCLTDFEIYLAGFDKATTMKKQESEEYPLVVTEITPHEEYGKGILRYGAAALVVRTLRCIITDAGLHTAMRFTVFSARGIELAAGTIQKPKVQPTSSLAKVFR